MRTSNSKDCRNKHDASQDWPTALEVLWYLVWFCSVVIIFNLGPTVIAWINAM